VFKVDMAGVQPALQKSDASQADNQSPSTDISSPAYQPPDTDFTSPAYEPPSAEPPMIDSDPLYNPPIESGSSQSSYTSPQSSFPRQTYNTARTTAQNAYSTIAAKGKNFLVIALVAMLALVGGCCLCLVLTIRWIAGIG
jgi:hypothetical protein